MKDSYELACRIAGQKLFIHKNYFRTKQFPLLYFRYRLLRPLLKVYNNMLLSKWKNQPVPWLTPAAIEILEVLLHNEMTGFEFGSGNSTLFLASRVKALVSVEHDERWFSKVKDLLQTKGLKNVDYRLVIPDHSYHYKLPRNSYEDYTMAPTDDTPFSDYYLSISPFPEAFFDFILVDGRARVSCVKESIGKLKPGGFLIVDNADRFRYREIHNLLNHWKKIFTTSGLTDTVFWFKP